jgi:ABC-type Mn2+/Zn2+ transport system ATPase subunit
MRAETVVKMDNAPLLNVRGVSVHYDGAISALENIDFCVSEKALVALLVV